MKTCTKCGTEKPPTEFYAYGSRCKACTRTAAAARSRADYAADPEPRKAYQRAYSRRSYWSLTPQERRERNKMRWIRWGRARYLRQLAERGAAHRAAEDPDLVFLRQLEERRAAGGDAVAV